MQRSGKDSFSVVFRSALPIIYYVCMYIVLVPATIVTSVKDQVSGAEDLGYD